MLAFVVTTRPLILFTLVLLLTDAASSYSYQDLQNLQSELFRNYSKSIRPLLNQSRVLDVEVALDTLDIVQADDVRQEVVLRAVLLTSWIDELLMWTPDLHGGLNSIHPERDIIWAPSIRMAGMEDENGLTSDWMGNHLLLSDGSVFIRSTGQLSMNCKFHLAFFPFDTQTCSMDFYVQDFTEKEVQLLPAKLAIVFDRMEPNGQWEIVSGSARTFIHGSGEQTFSALSLDLVMRRLYLFYVLNILLPYVLISLLTLLAFLVPAEGGERATFALTALLAQVVFLNLLTGALPRSSDGVPVVVVFSLTLLFLSAFAVLLSVLTITFHHARHPSPALSTTLARLVNKRRHRSTRDQTRNDHSEVNVKGVKVWVVNPDENKNDETQDCQNHSTVDAVKSRDEKGAEDERNTEADTKPMQVAKEYGNLSKHLDIFCLKVFSGLYCIVIAIFVFTVILACSA